MLQSHLMPCFQFSRLPFLPGLLDGELLSCFHSASNFLQLFCSSYFQGSDQEEVFKRSYSRTFTYFSTLLFHGAVCVFALFFSLYSPPFLTLQLLKLEFM
ncbi:hypothetical protein CHARACLAT_024353 [Characodon lateralis]|uniref:Uncharacterized protein n=1 Tax=Characodon lateralis TaxID=208331 RepID=A0ABU7EWB4_9TELE|nr:hypothetical protein [Characodon lateralis]